MKGQKKKAKKVYFPQELQQEIQQEVEEDIKIAAEVMQHVYGFSEQEASDYFELAGKRDDIHSDIIDAVGNLLFDLGALTPTYHSSLCHALDEWNIWKQEADSSPLLRRVLNQDFTVDQLESFLSVHPANIGTPYESVHDLKGAFPVWSHCLTIDDEVDSHTAEANALLRSMADDILDLVKVQGAKLAEIYIHDFISAVKDARVYFLPDDVCDDSILVYSPISSHPELAFPLWKKFAQHKESYKILHDNKSFELQALFPKDGMQAYEIVTYIAGGVISLSHIRNFLPAVRALLKAAPEDQRFDLFDCLAANPSALAAWPKLSSNKVTAPAYIDFILNHADTPFEHAGQHTTPLSITQELIQKKPEAAACLVENAGYFVIDINRDKLLDLCRTYDLAYLIARDYLAARRSKEDNKAELLMQLASFRPSAPLLKEARKKISALPDNLLVVDSSCTSYDSLMKRINAIRMPEEEKLTRDTSSIIFLDWFMSAYLALPIDAHENGFAELFSACYDKMQPEDKIRMRKVWHGQPATMAAFAQDVVDLYDAKAYKLMIRNHVLFERYKCMLQENDATLLQGLREIVLSDSANSYAQLNRLLVPEKAEEQDRQVLDIEQVDVKAFPYQRIIVWGGTFEPDSAKRIQSSVSIPVEFYDFYRNRRDTRHLTGEHAVIWMVARAEHSAYYAVKNHCKKVGAGFYTLKSQGYSSLIDFLRTLESRK